MIEARAILMAAAEYFYRLGWMYGTAGNLSMRHDDDSLWITASGRPKGSLSEADFVRVSLTGEVLESPHPNNAPSAETSIHCAIYSLFPEAQACYHVHSVEANLVSNFDSQADYLALPPLEMVKGLGIKSVAEAIETPRVKLAIFENYSNVPQIAKQIQQRFRGVGPEIPALLIRNHGVTVWGNSPEAAQNHLEIVEYIFRYLVAARQLNIYT